MNEKTVMTNPWIQTRSGVAFDLLAPTIEMVRAEDIAHALSRINRFSGHTHGAPYSVAHHSMLVADLLASWGAPPAIVREGLLHDAGEAYYGDFTSPVKRAIEKLVVRAFSVLPKLIRDALYELTGLDEQDARCTLLAPLHALTSHVDHVVREALVLPETESPIVKRADLVALAIERRSLFGGVTEPRDWDLPEYAPLTVPCGRIVVSHGDGNKLDPNELCEWHVARNRFLMLLAELDAAISARPT